MMHLLRVVVTSLMAIAVVFSLSASALSAPEDTAIPSDLPIVVVEVEGPMDQRSIDYIIDAITTGSAHLYILKIDSSGVSSGDVAEMYRAVANTTAPVVSWVGPAPAVAYGGAAYLVNHTDVRSAAPGALIGFLDPVVQRGDQETPSVRAGGDTEGFQTQELALADSDVKVDVENYVVAGFVDRVDPALGQLIISLDGAIITRGSDVWELATSSTEMLDGEEITAISRMVVFVKPGLLDRFLRLGARPEATYLFLLMGLAFAAFEFYAAGRGLMAAVGAVSLLIAGYGLATLPVWWPAIFLVLIGLVLLVWGFSQNRVDLRAVAGSALLLVAGFFFTDTRPMYSPALWMVVLAVSVSVLFIWYSLTTVVRGRFATPTVGREELLGRRCIAVSDLVPEGVVMIDGSRWRATADRGVVVVAGAGVEIVGVTGLVLEVDPIVLEGREEIM